MDKKYFFFLKWSTSPVIRSMKLKHFWNNPFPQSECLSSRNIATNAGEDVGREEILLPGEGGVQINTVVVEIDQENAPPIKTGVPMWPSYPTPGHVHRGWRTHREDITHPCALLALSEYPENKVSPDVHEHVPRRIRKTWDLYTMEFYSFARKN